MTDCQHYDNGFCKLYSNEAVVWKCNECIKSEEE